MKVLISRTSPGTIGGAELSAFDQAVVLKELGHTPVLATNLRRLKQRAKKEHIKTIWFPWINRGPGRLRVVFFFLLLPFAYLLALVATLRVKPDIINPHSREDQIAFTLSKFLHKKPVVWKDPGDLRVQLFPQNDNSLKILYRKLHLRAVRRADHIYLLNDQDLQKLASIAGQELKLRLSVVPASILFRHYDRSKSTLPKPDGKLIIGSLARLEKEKGLQYLITAVKKLGNAKIECWIANDGAYKNELEDLAEGADNIKFLDYTSNISRILNTLDIFVHPAEAESWGRVIKEAMYFGLPIVGSDTIGVKSQIDPGRTGLLFENKNADSLTNSLNRLVKDPELRKKLGENAKKQAVADGDFSKIVKEKILPIYKRFV